MPYLDMDSNPLLLFRCQKNEFLMRKIGLLKIEIVWPKTFHYVLVLGFSLMYGRLSGVMYQDSYNIPLLFLL